MVLADAVKRWHIVRGGEGTSANLYTGTDEHGQKVHQAAMDVGNTDTLQWTNIVSKKFSDLSKELNVTPKRFIRTTDPDHIKAVKHLWCRLRESGDIYEGVHSGWYCVSEESFFSELDIVEKKSSDSTVKRVTKDHGKPVVWVEEKNYMFKLSKYRERILTWLEGGNIIWPTGRGNDILEYLKDESNFKDISVSRQASVSKWGILVPGDEDQMIYVWFDALVNYLTVTGYPEVELTPEIHVIGKDILKFHAIYWPAFLMAADLPLPKRILVHGHWTVEGTKMSKSLNNSVDPFKLLQDVGSDQMRYFLLQNSRLDSDANFSIPALIKTVNNDLSNQLGNLMSRSLNAKFLACTSGKDYNVQATEEYVEKIRPIYTEAAEFFDRHMFNVGLEKMQQVLHEANRLFSESKPWILVEEGRHEEIKTLLGNVAYSLFVYAAMAQPAIPISSSKILQVLGIPSVNHYFDGICKVNSIDLSAVLQSDTSVKLFPRLQNNK